MPSHLTRVVFRSIIANKPLLYRGCLLRPSQSRLALNNSIRLLAASNQRRTFLGGLFGSRKAKKPELPPGLLKLNEVLAAEHNKTQPPLPREVAAAFNVFFSQRETRFEDYHILCANYAFKYLKENPDKKRGEWLASSDIVKAMEGLEKPPKVCGEAHLQFAKLLNEELGFREKEANNGAEDGQAGRPVPPSERPNQPVYLSILSTYGASGEARELATALYSPLGPEPARPLDVVVNVWKTVLKGFAREDNQEELIRTAELIKELSVPFVHEMQTALVSFFSEKGNMEQAKHWFSVPVVDAETLEETEQHGNTYAAMLKGCAKNKDLAYGHQVVASLLKNMPNKLAWDALFVWSAAIGKGVDEVDRMMNVMVRRNTEQRAKDRTIGELRPDTDTINALVEYASSKQDAYSAERYISLAEKWGIPLDSKTHTMQMQYRLAAKDIDGARTSYFGLQGSKDENCVVVVNKLIQAMCESKQHQFDDIMAIVDDLHEQSARFEPETVASLIRLHLRRGESKDAKDLMQVHAHKYGPHERAIIWTQLVEFVLDRRNSTADAWDTYQVLRQLFPEIPREVRMRLMKEFFERERSDMACHVFFHMRFHSTDTIRADRDVYAAAFAGFAEYKDRESIELAHNQLKLDLTVEPDTKIRNALMLAFSSVGQHRRAFDYWVEIASSKEGPTYNSIIIAFRVCENMPWGDEHAKQTWERLRRMDFDIDKRVFTAFVAAITNNLYDESVALLESAEEEYGFTPDLYM